MKRFMMPQHHRRQGSTLTEVLVSVMVLGIGLISVATLFPLAVVRAVRANQVTQGTILRYAAESQLDAIMLDPDWKYWMFSVENTAATNFQPVDDPTTATYAGSVNEHFPGNAGDDDGNGVINLDTLNRQQRGNNGWLPGRDGVFGVPGVNSSPGYSDTDNVSDDVPILAVQETRYAGRDAKAVIIDPIGWWEMTTSRDVFGGRTPGGVATSSSLPRLNGGHRGNNTYSNDQPRVRPTFVRNSGGTFDALPPGISAGLPPTENFNRGGYGFDEATARQLATIQDQFSTTLDVDMNDIADPSAIPPRDELALPSTLPVNILSDIIATIRSGGTVQATFFGIIDDDLTDTIPPKRTILSRNLLHEYDIDGDGALPPADAEEDLDSDGNFDQMTTTSRLMKWRSDEKLPAFFQVERIVLQTLQEDFTWMITARLPSPPPAPIEIDMVVFFNRRFEARDELPYTCSLVSTNSRLVWQVDYGTPGVKPNWVRKGNFMFDIEHAEWYLIVNVVDPENGNWIQVTLERDVRDTPDGPTDDPDIIRAAFMRGVIDVFPLEVK